MTAECLCVIPVTGVNAQVSHHTSTTLLDYLQPWAFIRIPIPIILLYYTGLCCHPSPDQTQYATGYVGQVSKKAVIVAVLASKINKYIYKCVCVYTQWDRIFTAKVKASEYRLHGPRKIFG